MYLHEVFVERSAFMSQLAERRAQQFYARSSALNVFYCLMELLTSSSRAVSEFIVWGHATEEAPETLNLPSSLGCWIQFMVSLKLAMKNPVTPSFSLSYNEKEIPRLI